MSEAPLIEIEWYLLVNFGMNAVALLIMSRIIGHMRIGRVLLSDGIGTFYAILAQLPMFHLLEGFFPTLLVTFAMAVLCIDACTLREGLKAGFVLMIVSGILAGMTEMINRWIQPVSVSLFLASVLSLMLMRYVIRVRDRRIDQWEASIDIRTEHGHVKLKALIDTGNRLHEPVSALPVVILGETEAHDLLPPGFDIRTAMVRLPNGYRLVGYGALGGRGQMICFRPEAVWVSYGQEWLRAPDVWVAVYPGALPGKHKAIAPPVIGRVGAAKRMMA